MIVMNIIIITIYNHKKKSMIIIIIIIIIPRFPDESSAKELFIRSDASEGSIPLMEDQSKNKFSKL